MSGLHDKMGKRAFELLPEKFRNFWAEESENIPHYCDYPDLHMGSQWENPQKERFYAQYCVMDNGRAAPHGPQDKEWRGATFGDVTDPEKVHSALKYYLSRTVENIVSGNVTDSARFAGTGAHVIQDCSNPGHTFNNILLSRMFPSGGRPLVFMHRIMDSWPIDLEAVRYRPVLLGRNIDEAVYHLGERIIGNMRLICADMVKLCQAIIGKKERTVSRIMQKWNAAAIKSTADFWYTAFVLAKGKIPAAMNRKFAAVDLAEQPLITAYDERFDRQQYIAAGIPFYNNLYPEGDPPRSTMSTNPYPFEPVVNCAYDTAGNPLELYLCDGQNKLTGSGLAAGTYGVATYHVPGTVFKKLEVTAGIHPDSPNNVECTFGIWCCESEPHLLVSGKTTRDGGVLRFSVDIPPECRTISLLNAGGDGKSTAVWLNMTLKGSD